MTPKRRGLGDLVSLINLLPLLVCRFDGGAGAGGGAAAGAAGAASGANSGGGTSGAQGGGASPGSQAGGAGAQGAGADDFLSAVSGAGLPTGAVSGFRNLLAQHGSAMAAAAHLYDENYRLRNERRELTNDDARKKLEAAGFKVLTKEEAAVHDSYAALGKPEDLTKIKREHGEMSAREQQREADKLIDRAAELHGYKPGTLFRSMVKANGLSVVTDKVEVDDGQGGKKRVERAFVVTKEKDSAGKETEKRTALDEYLRTNFRDDEAALPRADGQTAGGFAQGAGGQVGGNGTNWIQQPAPGGGAGGANPVADYMSSTYGHVGQQQGAAK